VAKVGDFAEREVEAEVSGLGFGGGAEIATTPQENARQLATISANFHEARMDSSLNRRGQIWPPSMVRISNKAAINGRAE
jgi:hypothetical protein